MNLFEVVKASINTQEAAQMYGIDANHHGMALCPFHNDRHPSLYVSDDHYHCFACGEHGDVIDLTAKLFERIKESFSIRVFVEYRAVSPGFLYKSSGHQAFPKTGF